MIQISIDRKPFVADEGMTILQAARVNGFEIPTFCDAAPLTPDGSCRVCLVEATYPDGTRKIVTACDTQIVDGLRIRTATAAVRNARKQAAAILLSLAPNQPKIRRFAASLGATAPIFVSKRTGPGECIHCGQCVRACDQLSTGVLQFAGQGGERRISLPGLHPIKERKEAEAAIPFCPTGALKRDLGLGIGSDLTSAQRRRAMLRTAARWVFFVLSVLSVLAPSAVGWLKLGGFRPEIAADAPSWLARINPFEGLVILLARGAGAALPYLPSLLILGLTLIGGRVWCGWICPMGTLFSLFGRNGRTLPWQWARRVKTVFFLTSLIFASIGMTAMLHGDPLVLFRRWVEGAADVFRGGALDREMILRLGLPLGVLLALNGLERGFYCRYLCPLGGCLGLIARFGLLRRSVNRLTCIECGACARKCPVGAIAPELGFASDPAECVQCGDCQIDCPKDAITFSFRRDPKETEEFRFGRIELIATAGLTILILGLLLTFSR